jgi:hypothetical protein
MKRSGSSRQRELGFAVALCLLAALALALLELLVPSADSLRLVATSAALAIALRILAGAERQPGRLTCLLVWLGLAAGLLWLRPIWLSFMLAHVGLIWLVRAAYLHRSLLDSLVDLCLTACATAFAAWAWLMSQDFALSLWCWLLPQCIDAAAVAIWLRTIRASDECGTGFEHAAQTAEQALRRIASRKAAAKFESA